MTAFFVVVILIFVLQAYLPYGPSFSYEFSQSIQMGWLEQGSYCLGL